MANKIKIVVESAGQCVNVPAIPMNVASIAIRAGLWSIRFVPEIDQDERFRLLLNHRNVITRLVQSSLKELKTCEPFRFIEIESGSDRILIDILR